MLCNLVIQEEEAIQHLAAPLGVHHNFRNLYCSSEKWSPKFVAHY